MLIPMICAWCGPMGVMPHVSHGICATHLGAIREALGQTGGEPAHTPIPPSDEADPDPGSTPP